MRKRLRLNQYGYYESILASLHLRYREPGVLGGGGNTPVEEPDVEPTSNGPDRDFASLASGTMDEPVNQPANPGAGPGVAQPTQARTPADPNQLAGVAQPAAATDWQSIREAAQAQGFQFDATVTNDRTALNYLLRQAGNARQSDIHAQLGRQLAPHAQGIQDYLRQQAQPQTPAAPARQPWEAPEFDDRWVNLVDLDAQTGLYTAKPGVSHDIAQKVNAYVEWERNLRRNPGAAIQPMVEQRARAIAEETFQRQFAAQAHEQTVRSIVTENSSWMYQVDQARQRMQDYSGQFIPTPVGAAYLQQLQAVQRMGVTDPRQQDMLAKQLVRGQYAQAYQAQQFAAQQPVTPQTQQAAHQPNRNPLQAATPSTRRANPAATEPSDAGLSLAERLRRDLAADGVTDSDVFNSSE